MKKLFLTLLFFSANLSAQTINIYELVSRGYAFSNVTQQWVTTLESSYTVDYKSALSCGGRDEFVNDKKPALAIAFLGRIWGSMDRGEDACVLDVKRYRPLAVYEYTHKLCTSAESRLTLNDFFDKTKKYKIGLTVSSNPWGYWLNDFNRNYGTQFKLIDAYINSGEVSRAVVSRDVDWGIFSGSTADVLVKGGKINCVATTDTRESNSFVRVFPKVNRLLNTYNGSYIIFGSNLTEQDIKKIRNTIETVNRQARDAGVATSMIIPELTPVQTEKYVQDNLINLLNVTRKMQK